MHHTLVVQRDHRCHRVYAAHEQPHLFDTIQHSNHIGAGAVCIVRSGQIVIHIIAVHNTYTCLTTVCEYGSGVLLHNVMGGYNRVSCCNGVHKLLLTCACVYEALVELAVRAFEHIFGHVARQSYSAALGRIPTKHSRAPLTISTSTHIDHTTSNSWTVYLAAILCQLKSSTGIMAFANRLYGFFGSATPVDYIYAWMSGISCLYLLCYSNRLA